MTIEHEIDLRDLGSSDPIPDLLAQIERVRLQRNEELGEEVSSGNELELWVRAAATRDWWALDVSRRAIDR